MFASNDELGQTSGWGWYVALGIALVIVGLIALWNVVDATLVTTVVVGWLLVIGGFVEIFGAFTRRASLGSRVLHILLGLYLLVGFDLVFDLLPARWRSRSRSGSC